MQNKTLVIGSIRVYIFPQNENSLRIVYSSSSYGPGVCVVWWGMVGMMEGLWGVGNNFKVILD